MKSGPELDEIIATQIMKTNKREVQFVKSVDQKNGMVNVSTRLEYLPYSTDIKEAWEVVEKFRIGPDEWEHYDTIISALIRMDDGKWMARYDSTCGLDEGYYERSVYSGSQFVIADTAPLAICLAACAASDIKLK